MHREMSESLFTSKCKNETKNFQMVYVRFGAFLMLFFLHLVRAKKRRFKHGIKCTEGDRQ